MHKHPWYLVIMALVFIVSGMVGTAQASSTWMSSFNSTYPSSSLVGNCSVCHTSVPTRNVYGAAYASAGHNFAAVADLDSDGDGFTNVTEINAGFFPGDANSHPTVSVTLSSIVISGPASVNENTTATYTATATMSDSSTKTVTPTWSENSTATTISTTGLLTASAVTSNTPVTVSASYTEGGVTKTADYPVTVVDVPVAGSVTINSPVAGTLKINSVVLDYAATGNSVKVYLDGQLTGYVSGDTLAGLANGAHTILVETTDASNNVVNAQVTFNVAVEPMAVTTLADQNGNGTSEIAGLFLNYATGGYAAIVKDSMSNTVLSKVNFSKAFLPSGLVATPDLNGNGSQELAMLGKDASGKVAVIIKDSVTGVNVVSLLFGNIVDPVALAVVPDTDGNGADELGVLGTNSAGRQLVIIKDLGTNNTLRTVYYPTDMSIKSLAVVADISGNSSPELAVLGVVNGIPRLIIKDAVTKELVNALFYPSTFSPVAVASVSDLDGNGADELVVTGVRADGKVLAYVKDSFTKTAVKTLVFPADMIPQGVAAVNDIDGNKVPEVGVLGVNGKGAVKFTLKDTSSANKSGLMLFPARQMKDFCCLTRTCYVFWNQEGRPTGRPS